MLYHLRKLRGMVPIDGEYAFRRSAYRLLPARNAPIDALLHCCVHKTASQWIRLILSDPRFYRATGLMPYFAPSMRLLDAAARQSIPQNAVIGSFFTDKQTLLDLDKPPEWRAFFVTRDPRELLVSRYYSARYSHREMGRMAELRQEMASMSDEEGLVFLLADRFDLAADRLLSFREPSAADDKIRMVKFEDLTGPDRADHWVELFAGLGIEMPRSTLTGLLSFYRVQRMRDPRAVGNPTEKYGGAGKKDWRQLFSGKVAEAFERRYGDLPSHLGYT